MGREAQNAKMPDFGTFACKPLSALEPIVCHVFANRHCLNPLVERQALPESPLLAPVRFGGDGADHDLADRVAALGRARQEQNRLLNLRSELQQIHDLRDAGATHVAHAGQVGLVGDLARLDEPVEPKRQGPPRANNLVNFLSVLGLPWDPVRRST